MVVAYACLLIAVILSLFGKNVKILLFLIIVAHTVAFYAHIVTLTGLMMVMSFSTITWLYFHHHDKIRLIKWGLLAMMISYGVLFSQHLLPGFNNFLILNKIRVSLISCPFSMYLNFDKVVMALILYISSPLLLQEKFLDLIAIKQSFKPLSICLLIIIPPAMFGNYLTIDLKISKYLIIWAINNLFFVCFAEEVFFRGIIQTHFISLLAKYRLPAIVPIIITSLFFGMAHIKGGALYAIFATVCGIFYGYTYHSTGRIFAAILVHFMLNLCHFIFFSYPASISMCP